MESRSTSPPIISSAVSQCGQVKSVIKMIANWRRPDDVNLNKVLRVFFTAQNTEQFRLRVLETEEAKEQSMQLIMHVLIKYDSIINALEFSSDPISVVSLNNWIDKYLSQHIAVGCFLQRDGEKPTLVAVDGLYVRNIRDEFPETNKDSGVAFGKWMKYMKLIERNLRYPEARKICNYLTSFGVIITPDYQDLDIQKYMITARKMVAEALNINLIGAAFIGEKMLEAAKVNKYKLIKKFNREKMLELGSDFKFINTFPIQIMGIRFKYSREETSKLLEEEISGNTESATLGTTEIANVQQVEDNAIAPLTPGSSNNTKSS